MELPIGKPIRCLDGDCGQLERVVIDPELGLVLLLVANWQGRAIGLSLDRVKAAGPGGIDLSLNREQVDRLPDYEVRTLVSPAAEWTPPPLEPDEEIVVQPVPHPDEAPPIFPMIFVPGEPLVAVEFQLAPEQAIELGDAPVEASDGEVGRVVRVGIDRSDRLVYVVVRRGWPLAREFVVPAGAIASLTGAVVRLRLDRRGVDQLPSHAA